MSITKRKLKNGKTVYDVREYVGFTLDGKRDRKQVACATLREAKIEQAKLIALRDARRNRSGRCTFGQYVDEWYWASTSELSASTRDTYEKELRLRLRPAFENVDMRDITRPMVQRMVDECKTKRVAEKALGTLKTILNQAMGDGLITSNPAFAAYNMPPAGKKRDNGFVITTFEDMKPLLQALTDYSVVDGGFCRVLGVLGLLTGLRPEERYGLDWQDIDFERKICAIRRAYLSVSAREGSNDLKAPKTALSARVVPIPADVCAMLKDYRDHTSTDNVGAVLQGVANKRVSPSTAKRRWSSFLKWCDKTNRSVPHVTIENCRHSYATSYLHAGGNIEDLSRLLGHSNIMTTFKRYVRPSHSDLARGVGNIIPQLIGSDDGGNDSQSLANCASN